MSLVIDLPSDLERQLASEAAQAGLPLPEYALRLLSTGREVRPTFRNGAELLQYWQQEGLVGSRNDIADSQTHARALRRDAETRLSR